MKTTLLLISIVFGLSSCDPAQTLEIENKSGAESNITFYFVGTPYHKFEGFWQEEPLNIKMAPIDTVVYVFGIGTWDINNSLDSLVARVEKVTIETSRSTEIFSGEKQVRTFFEDRIVDDRYRARIAIIIE